ncbi:MAG: hypothetical protein BRC25_02445 [Parcubacteria group bacterium SW_6_46_9]|nr:MAG: hypothetical protein BRC25_02445 [Parcubacteria group bacterium SW_6_46_9]
MNLPRPFDRMSWGQIFKETAKSILGVVAIVVIVISFAIIMGGCSNTNALRTVGGGDMAEECQEEGVLRCANQGLRIWENLMDQGGDAVDKTGDFGRTTANAREKIEASFGSESACFAPVLDTKKGYSMKFEIPGRKLLIVHESGEQENKSYLKLGNFERANAIFPVDRFASFMKANLLIRVYDAGGEPIQATYERVGDVYSKRDFGDKSCATALVSLSGENVRISTGDH